jgi:pimeloyl-ACP methyl ester carboxylesterase
MQHPDAVRWRERVEVDALDVFTMPVMAIGASNSLGSSVPNQVRHYARNVTSVVLPDSGHWIYEEHPAQSANLLLRFLR